MLYGQAAIRQPHQFTRRILALVREHESDVADRRCNLRFWRQENDYPTDERVGTLILDTPGKYL